MVLKKLGAGGMVKKSINTYNRGMEIFYSFLARIIGLFVPFIGLLK
jgi:hypothetical protein